MNSKTFKTLLAVAAALALVALLVSVGQRERAVDGAKLLPGFEAQVNEISGLEIRTSGNLLVAELARSEDGWSVVNRFGYPADIARIRANLLALAAAEIVEEKTSNPDFYDRLGVADIASESARGIEISMLGLDEPMRIIIGDTGVSGGEYAYVRRSGEAASFLVNGAYDLSEDTVDWMQRAIVDIPAIRIRSVTIEHADGDVLRIEKDSPADAGFVIANVAEDMEPRYEGIANSMGAVLADLELSDARPTTEFDAGDAEPALVRFESFDGLVLTATVWSVDDGVRVAFSSTFDETLVQPAAEEAPTDEDDSGDADQAAEDEAVEAADDKVRAEAARIADSLSGWVYTLPSYKSEQLVKRANDLLQQKSE